jgi:hypothetical protein
MVWKVGSADPFLCPLDRAACFELCLVLGPMLASFYALLIGRLVSRDRRVAVLVSCEDGTWLRALRQ